MYKFLSSLALFLGIIGSTTAQLTQSPSVMILQGTIDGKYEIELKVNIPAEFTDDDCADATGSYLYKNVLVPINLKGKVCQDGFTLHYYDKNEVIAETFELKEDKSSGKPGMLAGTWKKGTKTLKVELQEYNFKNSTLVSVQNFGSFVNAVASDFNLSNDVNWAELPSTIYAEGEMSPTLEALESFGRGLYITDHGIGYLEMQQMRMGMGSGTMAIMEFRVLPDATTPTFLVLSSEGGYYTENMNSDNPTEVSTSSLDVAIFQLKDGKMKNVTNSVCSSPMQFTDYNSYYTGFNMLLIQNADKTSTKLAWENGKFVKK